MRIRKILGRKTKKQVAVLIGMGLLLLALAGGAAYAALGGPLRQQTSGDIELQRGLVGWWKLDGNAKDSTPNRHNGTTAGTVAPNIDREGTANGAMSFSGSTTSDIDTGYNFPLQTFSVSIWAKADGTGPNTFSTLISNSRDCCSTNSGFQLEYNHSNNVTTARLWSGGTGPAVSITSSIDINSWDHFVMTYDGSTFRLYKNGSQASSGAYSGTIPASAYDVFIGRMGYTTGYSFGGTMDDARIYNRALSAAEVSALYTEYNPGVQAASSEKGLVGWWKMDGNANDTSPYRNAGTVNGATPTNDRKGKANGAYSFNGSNNYISIPGQAALGTSNQPYSITGWFKTNSSDGNILWMASQSNGSGWCLAPVTVFSGKLAANSWDGSLKTALGATTITPGNWYHFAETWSSTNGLRIYLNGTLDGSTAQTSYVASNATNYIFPGYVPSGCSTASRGWFNGSLDDIRAYSRELSAAEISSQAASYDSQINLNASPTNTQASGNINTGLVGYWNFNGNAHDSTPYRNNGTVNGATLTTDRKGNASSAYSFNGSNAYIGLSTMNISNAVSVSAWVYSTNFSQNGFIIGKNPVNTQWELFFEGPALKWRGGATDNNTTCTAPSNGAWHHVVGTQSGTATSLYIDGVQCAAATTTAIGNGSGVVEIGRFSSAYYFNGTIDDVRVYNRALSASEVQTLYTSQN